MKEIKTKEQKGITLVALVITIILMLILLGVTVTTALNGGLFEKTKEAADEYENIQNIEQIEIAYITVKGAADISNKTNREIFEEIKSKLSFEDATYEIGSQSMTITTKEGNTYTLLLDGNIVEGKIAYLDIADGSIDIKSNGYVQGVLESNHTVTGELVEYTGKYIITGTTTENIIRVRGKGTYDITIKDLDIKVSAEKESLDGNGYCAFNANGDGNATDCYVNITLEGKNYLYGSGSSAGLGFTNGTPNVDGVTNGSTLTIQGEGRLEVKGGFYSAGIGAGYTGYEASSGQASNIIINSGNIKATGGMHSAGIGSSFNGKANNIIINGGNIEARSIRRKLLWTWYRSYRRFR